MSTTSNDLALNRAAMCLFGAVLIDPPCANTVRRLIPTNIFAKLRDRVVYNAILGTEWPDIVQVYYHLKFNAAVGDIPAGYLSDCIKECPICFEYEQYANICIYLASLLISDPKPKIGGGAVV